MKKSSVVILTIVAALTLGSCASPVQKTAENTIPYDPVYSEQTSEVADTTRYQQNLAQQPYNYYYRSYWWDDMYRIFFPQRYYSAISRPGFVPRHVRHPHHDIAHSGRHPSHSGRRGGFGYHGSTHSVVS